MKVKSIGPVTFQQCAGFVRIEPLTANLSRDNPKYCALDSTWVHPESYEVTKKIIKKIGCSLQEIGTALFIAKIKNYLEASEPNIEKLGREYGVPPERVSFVILFSGETNQNINSYFSASGCTGSVGP